MGTVKHYLYDYDNPYKLLAHHIVGSYRPSDVLRVLTDNSYIKNLILKETRLQDMGGRFIDCIIEDILDGKARMEYMHQLDSLGLYYYSKLDKARLREEIRKVLEEAGIELPESYSADGKVSSAST